jgi:GNAT superfamily N-acetyltransferase
MTDITLRPPRPGDMGWVVEQHGALYAQEYGWNTEFEALVAEIVAGMIRAHDPAREAGWIAERPAPGGTERLGSAFVVRKSEGVAQLRLVLVRPEARGIGLGAQLTDRCLAFAREKGYQRMVLWTNANLLAARALYARRGFRLTRSEPYRGYGHDLVSETWELDL